MARLAAVLARPRLVPDLFGGLFRESRRSTSPHRLTLARRSPSALLRNPAQKLYRSGACLIREPGPAAPRWQKLEPRANAIPWDDRAVAVSPSARPALCRPALSRPALPRPLLARAALAGLWLWPLPHKSWAGLPAPTAMAPGARSNARLLRDRVRERAQRRRPGKPAWAPVAECPQATPQLRRSGRC